MNSQSTSDKVAFARNSYLVDFLNCSHPCVSCAKGVTVLPYIYLNYLSKIVSSKILKDLRGKCALVVYFG